MVYRLYSVYYKRELFCTQLKHLLLIMYPEWWSVFYSFVFRMCLYKEVVLVMWSIVLSSTLIQIHKYSMNNIWCRSNESTSRVILFRVCCNRTIFLIKYCSNKTFYWTLQVIISREHLLMYLVVMFVNSIAWESVNSFV